MATKTRDQRIVTVTVSQAELDNLITDRAKAAGLVDFDPSRIDVHELDAAAGEYEIVFSAEGV